MISENVGVEPLQFEYVSPSVPPAPPKKTIAALAETVVMLVAVTVVPTPVFIEPGATSNTTDASTPEKAITEPTALLVPLPSVKEKDIPSVPSATLYRIVLLRGAPELCCAPAIKFHPVSEAFVPVLPVCVILTIITSPAITPAGLLMVSVVEVVVADVAVPRCVMVA